MNTRRRDFISELMWAGLALGSVIAGWQLVVEIGLVSREVLPAPADVVIGVVGMISPRPVILYHLGHSLERLLLGYSLAMVVGIGAGLVLGMNRTAYGAAYPILSLLVPLPTLAWVPLLLILIGIGDRTIILAIFLGAFFPMVYTTMNGVRGVKKEFIWAAQSMGAGPLTVFVRVLMPGSLLSIVTGSRIAIGYSWRALVGAEMLAATSWGLGYLIYAARSFYDVRSMFVGLGLIALGGYLMDRVVMGWVQRRTLNRWGMISGE